MTQSTTAKKDVEGATSILRVFFEDALGTLKEAEVNWLGKLVKWRVWDWPGTVSEFSGIYKYSFTGTTVDLLEVARQDFYRGPGVVGKILSITDAYNMVADMPATKTLSHKPQAYRQTEASSVEEELEQASSTVMQQELSRYVEKAIDHLFDTARELYFEDGMETDFSRDLISLIEKYGVLAMAEISYLITFDRVGEEVAGEALRWLARVNDPSTYGWRFWLLEKSLSSKSPVVRDSAALGLLSMCDANAIPDIRKAIERETIAELRDDLQGALRELEVSLDVIPATGNK